MEMQLKFKRNYIPPENRNPEKYKLASCPMLIGGVGRGSRDLAR
jgi:hypothetical protein